MTKMVDDDTVYRDLETAFGPKDRKRILTLLRAWTIATDELPEDCTQIRILFAACINMIGTMGPAYCRVAAHTLLNEADETDRETDREDP